MTEDQLEILALDWFKEQGYSYAFGPEIGHDGEKPERNDYEQVLLVPRLLEALHRINPDIPQAVLEEVARIIIGHDVDPEQKKALRKFNHHMHGIEILTFDQLVRIANKVLDVFEVKQTANVPNSKEDNLPF